MDESKELLEELAIITTLVEENPCRMHGSILSALAKGVKVLIGSHVSNGASREQAAKYLKRDVRTLERWKQHYPDFPQARHDGHKDTTYDWIELVRFKLKHNELYKED